MNKAMQAKEIKKEIKVEKDSFFVKKKFTKDEKIELFKSLFITNAFSLFCICFTLLYSFGNTE